MSADYLLQVFSLTGKTAILTGATGGLGTSLAVALAKAGASIVSIEIPNDPNSEALKKTILEEASSSVRSFTCDVAKPADLRACYASIWEAGIIPDILVNCAGVMRTSKCEDTTDDDMDLVKWRNYQYPVPLAIRLTPNLGNLSKHKINLHLVPRIWPKTSRIESSGEDNQYCVYISIPGELVQ